MKTKDIREMLAQYDDDSLPYVKIGVGTGYRIEKCQIEASAHDDDFYQVRGIQRDERTGSPVLLLEAGGGSPPVLLKVNRGER